MEAVKRHSNMMPLLNRLAKEPVMLEFDLVKLPVTKLADSIDQADQQVEAITDDELRKERLKASIDRCREAFALLLLEIPPEQMPEIQKLSVTELLTGTLPAATTQPAEAPESPGEQMQVAPEPPKPEAPKPVSPPPRMPNKMPPPPVKAAAVPPVPAAPPTPVAEEQTPEPAAPPPVAATVVAPTQPAPAPTEAPPPHTASALATELLTFAALLKKNEGQLPEQHLNRLVLQHQLMALECEAQEKLRPGLKTIWPNRKQALLPYLDPQTQAVSAAVKSFLKQLQSSHPEWIGPFEFSVGWLQVMLRYWMSDTVESSFHPSLAECGFILCLFGQPGHDGLPSSNLLGMQGLQTPQVEELVARMNRLHRYRNQIFNIREPLSEQAQTQVQADMQTCFDLIHKLRTDEAGAPHG